MKSYSSLLIILTFFLTFSVLAQDSFSITENKLLQLEFEKSIVASTEDSQNHKTLLAAMKASGMDEILSFDGPFTVFAPSDSAFEKIFTTRTSTLLLPENKEELKAILRYHIIAGEFTASKILQAMCRGEGSAVFTTVQGAKIIATMKGTDIVLTDGLGNSAKIVAADASQCNGVIHEIDSVILPKKINLLP